jgi:hypothetical protein
MVHALESVDFDTGQGPTSFKYHYALKEQVWVTPICSCNVLWWASRIFRLLTMSFEAHFNEKWMFLGLKLSPWWFFNSTWWYNWPSINWWDQELFLEQMACKSTYHKLWGCFCFMLYWTSCGLSSSLKGVVVMSIDLSLSHGCEWLLEA